jgi:hypothetical protein
MTEWLAPEEATPGPLPQPYAIAHQSHQPQACPNLLDLALAQRREQWPISETVWLIPGRVFLKNEDCIIVLNLVGYARGLPIFALDLLSGRWRTVVNLTDNYTAWASRARQWHEMRRERRR